MYENCLDSKETAAKLSGRFKSVHMFLCLWLARSCVCDTKLTVLCCLNTVVLWWSAMNQFYFHLDFDFFFFDLFFFFSSPLNRQLIEY